MYYNSFFFPDRFSFSFEKWFAKFLSSKYLKAQLRQGLGTAPKCLELCECRHIAWDTRHKNWDRNAERFHPWKIYEMRYTEKSCNFYQFREGMYLGGMLENGSSSSSSYSDSLSLSAVESTSMSKSLPSNKGYKIQINRLQWRIIYK